MSEYKVYASKDYIKELFVSKSGGTLLSTLTPDSDAVNTVNLGSTELPFGTVYAKGMVLTDETTGTKYRVFVSNGKLTLEVVEQ